MGKFPNTPREHNQKTHSRQGEESHSWMKRELEGDWIVKRTRIVSHAKHEAGARELEEPRWFQPSSTIILLNRRKYELQPQLNLKRGNVSFSTNHCHALINNISWHNGSVEEACSVAHCTPFSLYHFVSNTSIWIKTEKSGYLESQLSPKRKKFFKKFLSVLFYFKFFKIN